MGGKEKKETREWSNWILFYFFKIALLKHILKKISTFTFGAWSFHLDYIQFTPSEGLKGFKKSDHQVCGPWKKTIFHGPTSKVHGVTGP